MNHTSIYVAGSEDRPALETSNLSGRGTSHLMGLGQPDSWLRIEYIFQEVPRWVGDPQRPLETVEPRTFVNIAKRHLDQSAAEYIVSDPNRVYERAYVGIEHWLSQNLENPYESVGIYGYFRNMAQQMAEFLVGPLEDAALSYLESQVPNDNGDGGNGNGGGFAAGFGSYLQYLVLAGGLLGIGWSVYQTMQEQ